MSDVFVLLALGAALTFVYRLTKPGKKSCHGCGGNCEGCMGDIYTQYRKDHPKG